MRQRTAMGRTWVLDLRPFAEINQQRRMTDPTCWLSRTGRRLSCRELPLASGPALQADVGRVSPIAEPACKPRLSEHGNAEQGGVVHRYQYVHAVCHPSD